MLRGQQSETFQIGIQVFSPVKLVDVGMTMVYTLFICFVVVTTSWLSFLQDNQAVSVKPKLREISRKILNSVSISNLKWSRTLFDE